MLSTLRLLWTRFLLVLIAIAFGAAAGTGLADPLKAQSEGTIVSRKVLALYHSKEEPAADQSRIHKFVEMPLNFLGYHVQYWDLAKGLPSSDALKGAAAAVTWFEDDIPSDTAYLQWATKAAKAGLKFVVFESSGAKPGPGEHALVSSFMREIGLDVVDVYVSKTSGTKVRTINRAIIEYERKLPNPMLPHHYVRLLPEGAPKRAEALLSVSAPSNPANATGDAVLIAAGPGGGYVTSGFAVVYDKATNRLSWTIDPIAFLSKALSPSLQPIADTTTIAGRRIYFSHIDGDSWNSISRVTKYSAQPTTDAEVVLRELIVPFPDLPVTVGAISCDIDLAVKGTPASQDIARQIYALPQVEVASHTHSHPFDWMFFQKYDRLKEQAVVARLKEPKPKYGILPRYSVEQPFDLKTEVAGSLAAVERLAPPNKRAELYLWSGDTKPFEAAVKATRKAGVRNMNGGDTRFDREWNSLAYVPALTRPVGNERQVYAANSNENTYTNEWTGPFDGFKQLAETHDRTEKPRRLKPMNVYYHMYSGEHDASLGAVRGHLERARSAAVIPISASRYAAIADSFAGVRFMAAGPMTWRVENRGALQTVRFEAAGAVMLDLKASAGVLGQNRTNDSLYVALDPDIETPTIALIAQSNAGPPSRPYLVDSRWDVSRLSATACEVSAMVQGFGPGEMTWAGLKPGPYRIEVTATDRKSTIAKVINGLTVGADGVLRTKLDADARAGLSMKLVCAT
jgi:hypothetical protein